MTGIYIDITQNRATTLQIRLNRFFMSCLFIGYSPANNNLCLPEALTILYLISGNLSTVK